MKCSKCLKIIPQGEEIKGRSKGYYCEECWKTKWDYQHYEKPKCSSGISAWWLLLLIPIGILILILVVAWINRDEDKYRY